MEKVFKCIESKREEYESLLEELVTLESYTPDKAAVDEVGDRIRSFAEGKRFHVKTVPFEKAGNGLLITWNEEAQLPPVAFTGHLDTVFPKGTFQQPLFRRENGRFYGPGVCDMKGGLVVGLLVMDVLKECGYEARPLKFIMIGDEELSEGLSGEAGKSFIRDSARGCAAAITLEGSDGKRITVGRKGSIRYKVRVTGRASHARVHYAEGISAIKEAAWKILEIEKPSDQEQITYNCGLLSGGTAPNTVPENAEFILYNRYWRMEQRQEIKDHVEGIIAKSFIPGTHSTFEIIGERLPMEATKDNYALAEHINQVCQKYGFGERVPYMKSSGSDASYTTMAGAPSVCSMGPIGGRAHSTEEYLVAESLTSSAKVLAAAIMELPEKFGIDKNK
ncbi:MAG: M20/M25/M40 family metallo-hydrolase [Lachnospiraceae bacterium]|nr:M20/M25/M40 family metallo-hydrolase [Lachnospiraceae bacterium]